MITEYDLREAIAECQGERNPNANTCIKLAAYLTIQQHLFGKADDVPLPDTAQSFASSPAQVENIVDYYGDTEFSRAIDGRNANDMWAIIDELMTVLQATNPRLYAGVMRRIEA